MRRIPFRISAHVGSSDERNGRARNSSDRQPNHISHHKDLLNPWQTIEQQNNTIIAAIEDWHKLLKIKNQPINNAIASMAGQEANKMAVAIKTLDTTRKKINSTLFIRTNKKEVAKLMHYFAGLLMHVGNLMEQELREISNYAKKVK